MFNTANKTAKAKLNNKNNTYVKDKFVFSFKKYLKPIEAIKNENGNYYCFTDNGREYSGIEVLSWVKKIQKLGAGEIIITSVDNEGTN